MTAADTSRHNDKPQKDGVIKKILRFFYRFFFFIGFMVFFSFALTAYALFKVAGTAAPSLPEKMALVYTVKPTLSESVTGGSFARRLMGEATTLIDVVNALDAAAEDDRVTGLVVKIDGVALSPAQIQELRAAVRRFRASGKFAHVYGESYGGLGGGIGSYYLASSFGTVWMQPVGAVSLGGVAVQVPFVRNMLEKLGVEPQFAHKGIYKSAPETFTETAMSEPHRRMMVSLVEDLTAQISADIAADRGMEPRAARALFNRAIYGDKAALAAGLVDKIGYSDEMLASLNLVVRGEDDADILFDAAGDTVAPTAEEKAAGRVPMVGLSRYYKQVKRAQSKRGSLAHDIARVGVTGKQSAGVRKIALIEGRGEIVSAMPTDTASFDDDNLAADRVVRVFRAAQRDADVVAVVFRIDSPGGSPAASESIRRAILDTRAKGKPVIVSMSGAAASGGYWVASAADKIVAQPATLTGSIGVFGGKFVMSGLAEKIGLGFETVKSGDRADMWSSTRRFSEEEMRYFDSLMGETYDAFIDRVAEGRKMPREKAAAVAEGRVFTGREALAAGLVDALGGLPDAVALAKEAAGAADLTVEPFPPRLSPFERLLSMTSEGVFFRPHINIGADDIRRLVTEISETEARRMETPRIVLD